MVFGRAKPKPGERRARMSGAGNPVRRFSFSMLGWALNEEENVAGYIDRAEILLRSISDDFELILIDDGSTDRTRNIIAERQATRSWLRFYANDCNRGAGYNAKRAISLATKEYVFWQPVDWSYDISRLPECWPLLYQYDVLQGVRQNTVSLAGLLKRRSDNPYKGFVSVVNYLTVRLLFRLPLHDYQNVTVYPRALVQSVRFESESAFVNPECLLKTWWKGATFKEFPVPFLKRERGKSAGTRPSQLLYAIRDIVRYWIRWIVLDRRPDKGFGRVFYWDQPVRDDAARITLAARTTVE
jgi:glycosyltransferase involved in cell wall biosynthesis